MDDDDRLGEDCIKLLTAEEAEAPYQNYMKNGKGEETTMGALGVLGSMDVVAWFDVTMVETLVFSIKCRGSSKSSLEPIRRLELGKSP